MYHHHHIAPVDPSIYESSISRALFCRLVRENAIDGLQDKQTRHKTQYCILTSCNAKFTFMTFPVEILKCGLFACSDKCSHIAEEHIYHLKIRLLNNKYDDSSNHVNKNKNEADPDLAPPYQAFDSDDENSSRNRKKTKDNNNNNKEDPPPYKNTQMDILNP